MEELDIDIWTEMKWFITEKTTLHRTATPVQATEPCSFPQCFILAIKQPWLDKQVLETALFQPI